MGSEAFRDILPVSNKHSPIHNLLHDYYGTRQTIADSNTKKSGNEAGQQPSVQQAQSNSSTKKDAGDGGGSTSAKL